LDEKTPLWGEAKRVTQPGAAPEEAEVKEAISITVALLLWWALIIIWILV
jgi:hypothetical protein